MKGRTPVTGRVLERMECAAVGLTLRGRGTLGSGVLFTDSYMKKKPIVNPRANHYCKKEEVK